MAEGADMGNEGAVVAILYQDSQRVEENFYFSRYIQTYAVWGLETTNFYEFKEEGIKGWYKRKGDKM